MASKHGKTALTNKHLKEKDFIRINCSPQTKAIDIYKSILRQLDIEFEEERTEKNLIEGSGKGGAKAKIKIPFLADTEATTEMAGRISREELTKSLNSELDDHYTCKREPIATQTNMRSLLSVLKKRSRESMEKLEESQKGNIC